MCSAFFFDVNRLSKALYPLVFMFAVYSLYAEAHKSWWSWCIHSLANGVYTFGYRGFRLTTSVVSQFSTLSVCKFIHCIFIESHNSHSMSTTFVIDFHKVIDCHVSAYLLSRIILIVCVLCLFLISTSAGTRSKGEEETSEIDKIGFEWSVVATSLQIAVS